MIIIILDHCAALEEPPQHLHLIWTPCNAVVWGFLLIVMHDQIVIYGSHKTLLQLIRIASKRHSSFIHGQLDQNILKTQFGPPWCNPTNEELNHGEPITHDFSEGADTK